MGLSSKNCKTVIVPCLLIKQSGIIPGTGTPPITKGKPTGITGLAFICLQHAETSISNKLFKFFARPLKTINNIVLFISFALTHCDLVQKRIMNKLCRADIINIITGLVVPCITGKNTL